MTMPICFFSIPRMLYSPSSVFLRFMIKLLVYSRIRTEKIATMYTPKLRTVVNSEPPSIALTPGSISRPFIV